MTSLTDLQTVLRLRALPSINLQPQAYAATAAVANRLQCDVLFLPCCDNRLHVENQ